MSLASPLERGVGWTLFGLLSIGSVAAIASDLPEDEGAAVVTEGADAVGTDADGVDPSESGATANGLRSFTLAATGDILVHEAVAAAAATPDGWDFEPMFASVAPIISSADLAICHIESPMSPDNSALSYYPAFNVPNELAQAVATSGYDTCSTASNHSLDTGRTGVEGTLAALDAVDVRHTGMARSPREAELPNLVEVNGVKVAHLSYTYGLNTGDLPPDAPYLANLIDEGRILSDAALARSDGAEFVVVSMHWGTEYDPTPNDQQSDVGPRLLGSPSIDLLLGHHAHVIQPVATVGQEYVAYGLGNFLSNQSPETCTGCPPGTQDGVILEFTVTEQAPGEFRVTDVAHTPTWVDLTTYEIVPVLSDAGSRDPSVLATSADRTSAALGGAGVAVASRRPA